MYGRFWTKLTKAPSHQLQIKIIIIRIATCLSKTLDVHLCARKIVCIWTGSLHVLNMLLSADSEKKKIFRGLQRYKAKAWFLENFNVHVNTHAAWPITLLLSFCPLENFSVFLVWQWLFLIVSNFRLQHAFLIWYKLISAQHCYACNLSY